MNDFDWIKDVPAVELMTNVNQLVVGDRVIVTDDWFAHEEMGIVAKREDEEDYCSILITFDTRFDSDLHDGNRDEVIDPTKSSWWYSDYSDGRHSDNIEYEIYRYE